jgi:hypothetical protein
VTGGCRTGVLHPSYTRLLQRAPTRHPRQQCRQSSALYPVQHPPLLPPPTLQAAARSSLCVHVVRLKPGACARCRMQSFHEQGILRGKGAPQGGALQGVAGRGEGCTGPV